MKRHATSWLVGLVLLVTAALVAFMAVPLFPCPTCRAGLFRQLARSAATGFGFGLDSSPVDCIDCGDRGKVTGLRAWGGPRAHRWFHAFIQGEFQVSGTEQGRMLETLVREGGRNPKDYGVWGGMERWVVGRFIRSGAEDYFLIGYHHRSHLGMRGGEQIGLILFSVGGKALDYVQCTSAEGDALSLDVFKPEAVDGASLRFITVQDGTLWPPGCGDLLHDGRSIRVEKPPPVRNAGDPGVCRIAIRNGRFEILTPRKGPGQ